MSAFPANTPITGVQASNLDNNSGASTRELPTEQAITNIARVSGTYLGTPAPGGSTAVADDDRLTRTIEDVRIRKSIRQPVPNVFRTGALAIYDITVDVSEYVNASGVVLTDNVPNGLCPLSNVAYTSTGTDNCGSALAPGNPNLPSIPMASVTPNPAGGFSVVFTPIPATSSEANDTIVVSYTALMRQAYEGGPLDGKPTVSGDTFTNTISSTASTTPIPNTPETGTVSGIEDGSSATLVTGGESISKGLLPRDARRVPPGTPCPATGYVDPTTVPPAQYFDKLAFRLGDEICFLLRVDFDPTSRTRNPVVTDFLPAGVEYVAGSMAPTPNNVRVNLNLASASLPAAGPLVLNLGDDDPLIAGTDLFVDLGAVMEVVFKAVVVDVPDSNVPLITGNLMKMRTENSAGQARSYRDRAGFGIVPAPPILLTKGVAAVDVPAFSTTLPDQDDKLVQQGSVVTYRIDLTNNGSAANFNDFTTRGFDVWDVLPDRITCANIVPGSITAFGETNLAPPIATCTDPGQPGHPSFAGNTARSAIRWNLATVAGGPNGGVDRWALLPGAGNSEQLTYRMTIPTPTSAGVSFVNDAALRSYEAFTNQLDTTGTYFPADNIDTSVTPAQVNAPAAADPSNVRTPGAVTTKTGTTGIEELPNNDRPVVAVPGETITYTIGVEIPPQVTVYQAVLSDVLPSQLEIVGPPPVATFFPDASNPATETPTFPAPGFGPNGFALNAATGALTFPRNPNPVLDTGYSNSTSTTQRFEVVITARVKPTETAQRTISNAARFQSVDRPGGRPVDTPDATYSNNIRQASPSVVKTNNSGGTVRAGQTVTYTLSGRNASGRPPVHDAILSDCIPAGLTFVAFGPTTPGGSTQGPTPGNPATNGCAVGTTFISFTVGTINAGTPVNRTYTATVENTAVGGNSYTNTARVVGSSLNNGVNNATVEAVYRPNPVTNTVRVPGAGVVKTVTPTVATVGELVTYSLVSTVPLNVNFYQAAVRDLLPAGLDPSTVQVLGVQCQSVPNATVPSPPPCDTPVTFLPPEVVPGGLLTAFYLGDLFGVPYDRTFTVRYSARLADVPSSVAGALVTNRAQTVWDNVDKLEGPTSPSYPWTNAGTVVAADTRIVEPSVTVAKSVSDTTPEPGEDFTYTLRLTNATGANVSAAYNAVVVDDVPIGVIVDESSISPTPTSFTPATAVSPGTIVWGPGGILAGPLPAGTTADLTYRARFAASPVLSSAPKINSANLSRYEGLPADEPAGVNRRVYTGNTTTATVTPQFPKLTTVKTAVGGEPTYLGADYPWRVTVTNTGTGTAFGVSINDLLPQNWNYVAGSARVTFPTGTTTPREPTSNGACPSNELCWFGLGNLLPGQSVTLNYSSTPQNAVVTAPGVGSTIRQTNTAASDGADGTGATRNLAGPYGSSPVTASTRIDAADVQIVKSNAVTPPVAGANYTWTMIVRNNGADTAVGPFTVVDTLPTLTPEPLVFVSATGTGWTCSQAAGVVTCTRAGTLASGASFPAINLTVRPPADFLGAMTNTATVSARTYDPNLTNNTSTVTATAVDRADLRIEKSRTQPEIVAGRTITYLLDVTNLGPSTSRATITVTDTLPANTTFVDAPTGADGDPWDCTHTAGVVTCSLVDGTTRPPVGDLLAGTAAPQIPITVLLAPGAPPGVDLTNTATVNAGATIDPVLGNNTDTDIGAPAASADLSINKQATGVLVAGQPATYQLRVDNFGPSDAAAPVISDTLPAGLTFRSFTSVRQAGTGVGSWNCPTAVGATAFTCALNGPLVAGDHAIVDVVVDVAPTVTGTITNTASVSSTTPDPIPGNNTDSDDSPFDTLADLAIAKTGPTAPITAGNSFTWTLQVTNNGPSVSRQPITVFDALPDGVEYLGYNSGAGWTCVDAPATVAGFSTVLTCTLPADIGPPVPTDAPPIVIDVRVLPGAGPGQLENVAAVRGTTFDPNLDNNVDRHVVDVIDDADLQIDKTPVTQNVRAGENATFTLQVTNNGPSTADNVIVIDDLPSGMTVVPFASPSPWQCSTPTPVRVQCELDALAPGPAPAITFQAVVGSGVPDGTRLTNTTSVDSVTPDRDPTNNDDDAEVVVAAEADLSITKTHPAGSVLAGTDLTFTMNVENLGPSDAVADVVVTDTLPTGFSFVSVTGPWDCTPGSVDPQVVSCTYLGGALIAETSADPLLMLVSISPDTPEGRYDNVATVASPTTDPVGGNNTATDRIDVVVVADVSIVKSHDPATVRVGQPLVFTLAVRNDGPSDAQGVVVTDTIPAGFEFVAVAGQGAPSPWDCTATVAPLVSCELVGPLPPGTDAEPILVTVRVLAAGYPGVSNTADVTTDSFDPDTSNNTSTDDVVVPPLVDLTITKTHAEPVAVGGVITYTLIVTNQGPTADPGPVTISDDIPDSLRPVSAGGPGVTCAILLQLVSCSADTTLEVGGSLTVTIVADVLATAYPSVTNTAVVGTPSTETDLTNNRATDVAEVEPLIALTLVKTLAQSSAGVANWLLSVTNLGPNATVEPIVVVDQLPAGLTYVSASGLGWVCSESAARIECSYADTLAVGATAPPISVVTNITAPAGTTVVNTATAGGGGPQVPSVTDGAQVMVPARPPTDLASTGSSNGGVVQLAMMVGLLGLLLLWMSKLRRRFPAV